MKYLPIASLLLGLLLLTGCDPNKDLYEALDKDKQPYNRAIEYTLVAADYSAVGGTVASLQAFTEDQPAMNHVPALLGRKFIALNTGSSAMVHYRKLLSDPDWMHAGFGYELNAEDYASLGVDGAFSPAIMARDNLPDFLLKKFRGATEGTTRRIIYNFMVGASVQQNLDVFRFDGASWIWQETIEEIPYVGYELTEEDYARFGGEVAQYQNFSDAYPAEKHLPVWLRNAYPFAVEGDEQVLKYKVYSGSAMELISLFVFDGITWQMSPDIVPRSEQYVFGAAGWAFDPTTRFIMSQSDYMHLAVVDPIPHAVYNDFGYYFGASAFYSNFDMRLVARRTSKNSETGEYWDPALGAIYDNEGPEAAVEEMFRRIVEEGIIQLLQHKYPEAVPQAGGIDVHYIVGFETFNDNFSRSYLEAEYRCTQAGSPPEFELIEGPRERR